MNKFIEKNLSTILLAVTCYFLFSISNSLKETSKYNSDIDLNHINQRLRDSFQNKETFARILQSLIQNIIILDSVSESPNHGSRE